MTLRASSHMPLVVVLLSFLSVSAALIDLSLELCANTFSYVLDDAYIHMAIAKNLVQSGVWGLTPSAFSSSTSSILYTLVLSLLYWATGPEVLYGLGINVIAGACLLVVTYKIMRRESLAQTNLTLGLLAVCFFTPMPVLVMTGMEHLLHSLLILLAAYCAAHSIAQPWRKESQHSFYALLFLGPLATSTRYESLFVLSVICGLMLLRGRPTASILVGLSSIAPVVMYGIVSLSHGSEFLPNSLLLKGTTPAFDSLRNVALLLIRPFHRLYNSPWLSTIVVANLAIFAVGLRRGLSKWNRVQVFLAISIVSTLIHLEFAGVGWLYRYEAYLVALNIIGFSLGFPIVRIRESLAGEKRFGIPGMSALVLGLILVLYPLAHRGLESLHTTPLAARNIYENQLQVALFLNKYYPTEGVAANDVGAISYYTRTRLLDLWGLGDIEVLHARRQGSFSGRFLDSLARSRNVRVAMVYADWFTQRYGFSGNGLPWTRVAVWHVDNFFQPLGDNVAWYSVNPSDAQELSARLREFSASQPANVRVELLEVEDMKPDD